MKIIKTNKVFDFGTVKDSNGNPSRYGCHVYQTVYQDKKGKERNWIYASRNPTPQVTTNAVVIVAKVGNQVVITDEFRIPINNREYGFPAGLCEPNLNYEENAIRELREDPGLHVTWIYPELITGMLVSSAGLTDETIRIVFMDAKGTLDSNLNEDSEEIHPELMNYGQVMKLFHDRSLLISAKAWGIFWGWSLSGSLDFAPPGTVLNRHRVVWNDRGEKSENFGIEY